MMWWFRKVFQIGENGLRVRTRCISTVNFATSMPRLWSSPMIRGPPQIGLACDMFMINAGMSLTTTDPPGALTQPSPRGPELLLLPGDDRTGLHEGERILLLGAQAGKPTQSSRSEGCRQGLGTDRG
jgi:hypothetical protein